jgi:hypothetical protein
MITQHEELLAAYRVLTVDCTVCIVTSKTEGLDHGGTPP